MTGAWVAQGIYTATKLGIVDAVNRLIRMLASRGEFTQRRDGKFALTALSDVLRTDAADSMRGLVRFWGDPLHWEHWGRLTHSVRTGRPSVDELRAKPTFEFLGDEPELAAVFNDAMTGLSDMESPWVESAYDFSRYDTIVDVGDGHGRLLAAILRK
jgi:O-methyltransferase domain